MPHKGFKSITVSEAIYTAFENHYKKLKEIDGVPPGIHTFTGYVVYRIENHIDEAKKWKKLASKIKFVNPKFTASVIQIKVPDTIPSKYRRKS